MDMLKRAEQVQDIVKLNDEVLQEEFLSENDYLAKLTNKCLVDISDTLDLSKMMLNELEGERIAIPIETMFEQFSTHICEAFAAF